MMAKRILATDFTVGWVCALPVELAAARHLMDEEYEDLDQHPNDHNSYSYGRIGVHNVVAACLPAGQTGNDSAAVVAGQMRSSFPWLRFSVLVGIGGGVPSIENSIRLGDVVISQPTGTFGGVVQFDFGKTGPDGRLVRTGSLNAPSMILLNALNKMRANDMVGSSRLNHHLSKFSTLPIFAHPGPGNDALFNAQSQHIIGVACNECEKDEIMQRNPRETQDPALFFGNIASGNRIIEDAQMRDRISQDLGGILCFETEAAALMNNVQCLVIRGICDYADAHKNIQWQPYAAATAAACATELLRVIPKTSCAKAQYTSPSGLFKVPFGRNDAFVGRDKIFERLLDTIPPDKSIDSCQRTIIEGLGGVGKTQIALEAVYRIHEQDPDCSIFWVPAMNKANFENACREIGQALGLGGINDDKVDLKALVKTALETSSTKWLLVIDNADEVDLLFDGDKVALREFLPVNRLGSILFTTRSREVTMKLDILPRNIHRVAEMSEHEAISMLRNNIGEERVNEATESSKSLVNLLACLPLAVKQASAFIAQNGIPISRYLEHFRRSDKDQIKLLSRNFEDQNRYHDIDNPIATTWLISFRHIQKKHPSAARCLRFISFLAAKAIPKEILPKTDNDIQDDEAIGLLKGYAFISEHDGDTIDIHRLVRLAMRNWVDENRKQDITRVIQHLSLVYPYPKHANRPGWIKYVPHVQSAMEVIDECDDMEARANLMSNIGVSYALLGNYKEATSVHERAFSIREALFGIEHRDTLFSLNYLGYTHKLQRQHEQAEEMHRRALMLARDSLGPEDPLTLHCMNDLGIVLLDTERYEEAEKLFEQTLQTRKRILSLTDPDTLITMNNLAICLDGLGRTKESEQMHQQTLKLKQSQLGSDHPSTLASKRSLASFYEGQERFKKAEQILRDTFQVTYRVQGHHPDTFYCLRQLRVVLKKQGRFEEADKASRYEAELQKAALVLVTEDAISYRAS